MLPIQPITDEEILYAEGILLPEGKTFDDERRIFIKNLDTIDLQAVPGSGKTTALLAKLLILEKRLPFTDGSGILVLSHTNTAIDEIKDKIQKYCPNLFKYPNFIGTIQSFVDKFLAIPYYCMCFDKKPYRIDSDIYDDVMVKKYHYIDNSPAKQWIDRRNNPEDLFKNFRFDNNLNLIDKKDGKIILKSKKQSKTYKFFVKIKKEIFKLGILHYDDTYFLANRYLQKYPKIKELLQKRFSYVFVDEMQDMAKHQYDLLENLFYDNGNCSSKFQRIGDKNQAIYDNIENETNWIDRVQVLTLSNSHRLSPNIANVVKKFALDCSNGFDIVGKNNCAIKPHIILYDDNSKEKVIPKFAELVKHFRNKGELKDFGKYPVKAICWIAKMDDNTKIRLGHYFPDFKKDIDKPKQDYTCLKDYLLYYDKSNKTIKPIQDNILNAFLKILRLENILNEERYFTKLQLLNRIKDQDFELFQSFRKQLYLWSMNIIKGEIDKVFEELKTYVNNTFIKIFDKDTLQKSSDFLNNENASPQVIENTQNNIYSEEDINIEITTIHSVKGQTHCATLYLESFYDKDGRGENAKSYESERLANAFLGSFITDGGKRVQQSLKMTYVGFSRPTNLLCVAIHKDRFNKYLSGIDRNDWEIIECN